jgi:hypothetical protein
MGLVCAVAIVWNIPGHDARAGHMTMHQRPGRSRRLEPVDLLQIAEPNFGSPTPVPITMYSNQHVIDLHDGPPPGTP